MTAASASYHKNRNCSVLQLSCVAAFLVCTPDLKAQGIFDSVLTQGGWCRMWQAPPGGSNAEDRSYRRCALQRLPVLRSATSIAPPRFGLGGGGSLLVVVSPDGTVDTALTRSWSMSLSDTVFFRRALQTIRSWRFDPGIRNGAPVRSAFNLEIRTNSRADTVPSRLEWRYVATSETDSLIGTWIAGGSATPLSEEQTDSIYAATVRQLVRMRVVFPEIDGAYCVVSARGDSATDARITKVFTDVVSSLNRRIAVAPFGCRAIAANINLELSRIVNTENGRAVLYIAGDSLLHYPFGINGRAHGRWSGRCVADMPAPNPSPVGMECSVSVSYSSRDLTPTSNAERPIRTHVAGDSLHVTLFATTRGAYAVDTMRAFVPAPLALSQLAIRDSIIPCGAWFAATRGDTNGLRVVTGDFPARFHATSVSNRELPQRRGAVTQCAQTEPVRGRFVAFLHAESLSSSRGPVTLCYADCARQFVLDPATNVLPARPHLEIRLRDLSPDAGMSDQLDFRVVLDPVPPNIVPIALIKIRGNWHPFLWSLRSSGPDRWDYGVTFDGGLPSDTVVHIFFIQHSGIL